MSRLGRSDAEIEDARRMLKSWPLIGSSSGRNWRDIWLDEFDGAQSRVTLVLPSLDHLAVSVVRGPSPEMRQVRLGQSHRSAFRAPDIFTVPKGCATEFSGFVPRHLRIAISDNLLAQAADEFRRAGVRAKPEIKSEFRIADPFLHYAADILAGELTASPHPAQDLLVESLATSIASHVLREYGPAAGEAGMPMAEASRASIRRVLDYIAEANVERFSLDELAEVSGLSRFHLSRLFKKEVGHSLTDYIETARIEKAKVLLRTSSNDIADIAMDLGFSDQSHFTRRFKLRVGCTPAAYMRKLN